jgi:hypothetical protein
MLPDAAAGCVIVGAAHACRFHPAELLPLFVRRQRAAAHSGRECGQEGVIINMTL